MIYTSYFAKYKGPNGVSIARYTPSWFKGPSYKDLAPSEDLLKWWKTLNPEQHASAGYFVLYTKRYLDETLSKLDPAKVAKDLDGKVLLCYENLNKDVCHREIVAVWLEQHGFPCKELEDFNEVKGSLSSCKSK